MSGHPHTADAHLVNCPCGSRVRARVRKNKKKGRKKDAGAVNEITVAPSPSGCTTQGEVDRFCVLCLQSAHSGACEERRLETLKPTHPPPTLNYTQVLATLPMPQRCCCCCHPATSSVCDSLRERERER